MSLGMFTGRVSQTRVSSPLGPFEVQRPWESMPNTLRLELTGAPLLRSATTSEFGVWKLVLGTSTAWFTRSSSRARTADDARQSERVKRTTASRDPV
jgi:hypothetical protein